MNLSLSDLIVQCGDENIGYQNLDLSIETLTAGKKGNKITFRTDQPFGINGTEKLGLVVWLDRKQVSDIVAAQKIEKVELPAEKLEGHDLLRAYVKNFESGAQGCDMDYESAQALAIAIRDEITKAGELIEHLAKPPVSLNDKQTSKRWLESHKF